MTCGNCGNQSFHVKITLDGERCHNCGEFAEASGAHTDGAATRNSFRLRSQQGRHEGDLIPAHIYDPATRSAKPNPDFIRRHPQTAHLNYTPEELEKAGMPALAKKVKQRRTTGRLLPPEDVQFKGNTKEGIKKVIKNVTR